MVAKLLLEFYWQWSFSFCQPPPERNQRALHHIPALQIYFWLCDDMFCPLLLNIDETTYTSVCPTFGGNDPGIRAEFVHSLKDELSVMCGFSCSQHPSAFTALSVSPPDLLMQTTLFLTEAHSYC
jgi:hypothetical protein